MTMNPCKLHFLDYAMRTCKQLNLLSILSLVLTIPILLAQAGCVSTSQTQTLSLAPIHGSRFVSATSTRYPEQQLVGTWLAVNSQGNLAAGTIAFQSNGIAIVAPNDRQPMIGKWHANAQRILITFKHHARSLISYIINQPPGLLTLKFANGAVQQFARLPVRYALS